MKRILTIIGCVIVLAAASSCTKKYINANTNVTVYADIKPTDWAQTVDGKSDSVTIKINQLTPAFNHIGGVIASIWYTSANAPEVYENLPEVYGGTSFTFVYNTGYLTLYAQSPDGTTPVKPNSDITAKIVLVDSN